MTNLSLCYRPVMDVIERAANSFQTVYLVGLIEIVISADVAEGFTRKVLINPGPEYLTPSVNNFFEGAQDAVHVRGVRGRS